MRPVFIALLLFVAPGVGAETLSVMPGWKAGDAVRYVVVRHTGEVRDEKRSAKSTRAFHEVLFVRKKLKDGYLLEWHRKLVDADLDGRLRGELQNTAPALLRLLDGVRVKLRVDRAGEFVAIINTKEIAAAIAEAAIQLDRLSNRSQELDIYGMRH